MSYWSWLAQATNEPEPIVIPPIPSPVMTDRELIKLAASGTDRGDALLWKGVFKAMLRVMAEGL